MLHEQKANASHIVNCLLYRGRRDDIRIDVDTRVISAAAATLAASPVVGGFEVTRFCCVGAPAPDPVAAVARHVVVAEEPTFNVRRYSNVPTTVGNPRLRHVCINFTPKANCCQVHRIRPFVILVASNELACLLSAVPDLAVIGKHENHVPTPG